ncbi:hypothetical protein OSCT_1550 [Oscillochloris trichoides DG-6]|uniref:Uncharacterized protein n=1 Tax=Oscillochloris trichoides DG-6 TaxID=765420 RepID=E1IDZ9_9CHLR|nr:tetratricopeptide repeat protein [Oscillochloris trichoides]EFO80610.1 hypothetical protein OSCT_1550 [Oscillochloris trichoides DG-6]
MSQRIIQITDAPLPSPDPWAADPVGTQRCPACALVDPGKDRCRRCKEPLTRQIRQRKPITANMANLLVMLTGRGPLLIIIAAVYPPDGMGIINPWSILLTLEAAIYVGCGIGMAMLRWRWTWFMTMAVMLLDSIIQIVFQFIFQGNALVPVAAIISNFMVLGMMLIVYDEVRIDTAIIGMPPDHALPKTPQGSYNLGVEYSKLGQWYFAARLWQRAVALEHSEGRYRRALGTAYLHLGEHAAAHQELQAAHWLMPDDEQTRKLMRMLG